jgi:hypothetical protein
VITGRDSPPLRVRLKALGVEHAVFGTEDKRPPPQAGAGHAGAELEQAAAMGDDWPDLPCCAVAPWRAPANAHAEVRALRATYTPRRAAVKAQRASSATCCWWPAATMRRCWRRHGSRRRMNMRGLNGWDQLSSWYLPVLLMGLLALGTWWLVRNAPAPLAGPQSAGCVPAEPDYFMRRFSVKSFDANGRLQSEVIGAKASHYPDTDTLEIRPGRACAPIDEQRPPHRGHGATAP